MNEEGMKELSGLVPKAIRFLINKIFYPVQKRNGTLEEFKQILIMTSADLEAKGELIFTFPLKANKGKGVEELKDKESEKEETKIPINKTIQENLMDKDKGKDSLVFRMIFKPNISVLTINLLIKYISLR